MTTDAAPSGREYGRAAFVLGGVLAVVLAGLLLPALVGPFDAAPLESLLSPPQSSGGGAGGQLGALDPGDSTSVGGLDEGGTAALRSQSAETHFVVESTEAAYWRTGAYDTYTGAGWDRSGDAAPYDGSIESGGLVDRTLSYRVELKRAAGALPTVWRPRSVETEAPIEVTDGRAIASSRTVDPGTAYTATSARPPDDPATLAAAGDDYPDAIEDRYTQLPDSTPDRLGEFTDQLTDGAGSPYETAARIERWLEANKSYSLNVSDPGGDRVASDFVFDMDEGYCEYFATSMVTMLRTQDVPARYVVGYSTGQPTGENTYTVRGMNAHAWVEVYFPDVGWVQFDPTPGRERMQAEQDALQEQDLDADDYEHTETGSPGERFSPDESGSVAEPSPENESDRTGNDDGFGDNTDPGETDDGSGSETDPGGNNDGSGNETDSDEGQDRDDQAGSYEVALSDRPVPGANVTVRVTSDGSPAAGVVVLFNGESIGETDTDGTVIGTVPYERRLNVTVRTADDRGAPAGDLASDNRLYAGISTPYSSPRAVRATNRTYEVPTDATLSITGTVATGRTVTLTATVEGQAIPNATVERDGERVGVTDGDGRLDVALPDRSGSTTLSVRRGAVGGNRTLELHELELTADPRLPVALPWTGVTVTAELGNETVAGLPVSMGGERIGMTGVDGTLSASLPLSDSVSLVTTAYGQRATTTVTGLWANLALVFGALAAVPLGVVVVARRRGISPGAALDRLVGVVLALPRYLLVALVTAADTAVDVAARVFRNGRSTLRELWAGNLTRDALAAAVRGRIDAFAGHLRSLRPGADARSDADGSTARVSIRAAWAQFLTQVSVTDPETKTPGELAAHAIERDGLPADAVETLRDAFRAVEYGARAPEAKLPAVQSAVERLDSAEREDER
ncbi:transglutaminase domain-containing protein [Halapricum desulfuricans]|uniref:Transglutaminase-like cysteine protease n=1 Tax=Halapricum desulfuricans TaxID=2841257 RepID=A0A897N1S6_9EURY|nr:transglutaminase domain-containing protein [Halapricum desulfuricans]QSG05263.1 Transglutaminase-like cysteine protease [Halapricum desulfuricans]